MDHAFFLSIFSVFSHARAGYFFGVLKTADKLLIFVVLAGALFVVWKLRERILLFLTGDTRLRVDIYDFVQCLLCCGCAGRCCPAIVPGASRVVRLKRVECRNFPAHDWMGTSDLFLKVSLGTNAELSTRVREKKRHVCIFTEQLEVNVKNPCCGPCTKWCNCAQSCGDEDCRAYCSCDQEMHIILMDQDVAFHDEVDRETFRGRSRHPYVKCLSGWPGPVQQQRDPSTCRQQRMERLASHPVQGLHQAGDSRRDECPVRVRTLQ